VKEIQDFVKAVGADHLVCVNAGTGTAKDAAEWVKWANKKMKYGAKYWEIGNELSGGWEAGNTRPDGRKMDGTIYAGIFLEYAKAMRKMDKTIKIGGPTCGAETNGYIPDLLRIAGSQVDFLSWHDYFTVGAGTPEEMVSKLDTIKTTARQVKEMVRKYQPSKADRIEIGLTEWNVKLNSDVYTANLFSGVWTAAALAEMMGSDMDYATVWDGFTQDVKAGGGHGFILEEQRNPKAQYWAFQMVNKYFGNELLASSSPTSNLRIYAARDDRGDVCVMAVNTSTVDEISASVELGGMKPPAWCESFRLSAAEYKWNPAAFNTLWNTGPSRSVLQAAAGKPFSFPAYSVTVLRFQKAADPAGSVKVLGPEKGIFIAGRKSKVRVLLLGKDGTPLTGETVSASFKDGKFVASASSARTAADGIAEIEILPPSKEGSDTLALTAAGLSAQYPVTAVTPRISLMLPKRAPDDESVTAEVFVLYQDGTEKPLAGFNGDFVLAGPKGPVKGTFKDGVASVELGKIKMGKYSCKADVPSLKLSSAAEEIQVYGLVEKETVVLKFDSDADMTRVAGKGNNRLDMNVRANQGVLAVKLDNYNGWAQEYLNFVKFNEVPGINWKDVVAVTFDLMVGNDYRTDGSYANLVFALQSTANYWMPAKDFPLNAQKKGEWTRVRLDITNPDWQKAMAQFFQIMVIFNSEKAESGTLYFDNLGFVEKTERK
jgi:alpha-L-arabinofuranosidase